MGNETNALLALKNAWAGTIAASDRLRELDPSVQGLAETTDVATLDLETFRHAAAAQSIAASALKGLIDQLEGQLQRRPE